MTRLLLTLALLLITTPASTKDIYGGGYGPYGRPIHHQWAAPTYPRGNNYDLQRGWYSPANPLYGDVALNWQGPRRLMKFHSRYSGRSFFHVDPRTGQRYQVFYSSFWPY